MKTSDGFDARRLRPREPKRWRLRLGALLGAAGLLLGLLTALLGGLSAVSGESAMGGLAAGRDAGIVALVAGLIVAWLGLTIWRRCRRRLRRDSELSMSPDLLRRRG